jgi:hypothetical protein
VPHSTVVIFFARGQICQLVILPGIFARPFSGGINVCTIDHRQTVSQWKWKRISLSVTNVLLPGIFSCPFSGGIIFCAIDYRQTVSQRKRKCISVSATNNDGNRKVFPFRHPLKLAMETEMCFRFFSHHL